MRILATYSIKGGVGKTSSAVCLAHRCATLGHRTLLWDLDPQGAASYLLRVKPKLKGGAESLLQKKRTDARLERLIKATEHPGLDLLPSDFSERHLDQLLSDRNKPWRALLRVLRPLWKQQRYDLVFLDCAPSISLVSESIFYAAEALLVPLTPSPLSLRALRQLRRFVAGEPRLQHLELLPFFTMVDRRKRLHRTVLDEAALDAAVLRTVIPSSVDFERMTEERAPIGHFAAASHAAAQSARLWNEIATRLR